MLPPKPLSEMTEDEILTEIRSIRAKRVVATTRASKPRGSRRLVAMANLEAELDAILNAPDSDE